MTVQLGSEKIQSLCDAACDHVEDFMAALEINCRYTSRMAVSSCPVHGGDNTSAWNFYYNEPRGIWKCRTQSCHQKYGKGVLDLIVAVRNCSREAAIKFLEDFNKGFVYNDTHKSFINEVNFFKETIKSKKTVINKSQIRERLSIPSKYFIDRGYSAAILDRYDVGDCWTQKKYFYGRAVVPVYDENDIYIGATGRSVFQLCPKCQGYHIGYSQKCPDKPWLFSKWRHTANSSFSSVLYNFNNAKSSIKETGTIIVVEGAGDVWRFEEADVHNSVAICGANLLESHIFILEYSGAQNIILATDNDDAGRNFRQMLKKRLSRCFNIYDLEFPGHDIGELKLEEIKSCIAKFRSLKLI